MKKRKHSRKAIRYCRKPLRNAPSAKAMALFDIPGLNLGALFSFGPLAKKKPATKKVEDAGDAGWGKIFAKLNIRSIVKASDKEMARRKKEEDERHRKWGIPTRSTKAGKKIASLQAMLPKKRASAVVVKDDRAKELTLEILGSEEIRKKFPFMAAYFVNAETMGFTAPDVKTKSAKLALRNRFNDTMTWSPDKMVVAPQFDKKLENYLEFWNYKKGQIERLAYKDLVKAAEEIVQSPKRPKWMTSVDQALAKWKADKKKREREEKASAAAQKRAARRASRPIKWKAPKPPSKKEIAERQEKWRKHQEEWKRHDAIRKANKIWLGKTADQVRELIKKTMRKEPDLRQIGVVIAAALKKRMPKLSPMIYPETDSNSGKPTGKLTMGGRTEDIYTLIPGAPQPVIKKEKEPEEEESADEGEAEE